LFNSIATPRITTDGTNGIGLGVHNAPNYTAVSAPKLQGICPRKQPWGCSKGVQCHLCLSNPDATAYCRQAVAIVRCATPEVEDRVFNQITGRDVRTG